jgi:LemA protein
LTGTALANPEAESGVGSAIIDAVIWAVIIAAAVLLWSIVSFNLLIRDRQRVAQAWSDVGVQLKRRHDLIPKLVETVKQYSSYEGALLEKVTELRARSLREATPVGSARVEMQMGADLRKLLAVAESYPDLKAAGAFIDLQRNLTDVETQIQYARRYYNGTVNNLNTRINTFPDLIIARLFGFRPAEYFNPELPETSAAASS